MRTTTGWKAGRNGTALERAAIERRDLSADDIAVRIDYCGVCHTDLHAIESHVRAPRTPLIPGHEFTGTVTETGGDVTRFAVGDTVAIGNIVDSCGECAMCLRGQENFCREFPTLTYGGTDRHDGSTTLGAFAREYIVRDRFAHRLPEGLDPAAAAPLMCAGITVWEPLRALGAGPGVRVAVAGLGGLGHLAVKLAVALGAETTVVSRSADKADDARRLGADDLVVSTDRTAWPPPGTGSTSHRHHRRVPRLAPYLRLVAVDGTLSQLGHLGADHRADHGPAHRPQELSSGRQRRPSATAPCWSSAPRTDSRRRRTPPSARVTEALDRLATRRRSLPLRTGHVRPAVGRGGHEPQALVGLDLGVGRREGRGV